MRRLYAVMVIFSVTLSFTCSAQQHHDLYVQFSNISNGLLAQFSDSTADTPMLAQVTFSYVHGQGGQFYLSFEQPLQQWQAPTRIAQAQINATDDNAVALAATSPVKQQFEQTRSTMKALSHQIYSLERQLSAMENSQADLSGAARQLMQQRINDAQTQLAQRQAQKASLKPRYEQLQQQFTSNHAMIFNPQHFLAQVRTKLAAQLCTHEQLNSLIPATESIALVLLQTGNFHDDHYQSTIYNFPMAAINACSTEEINSDELLSLVVEQKF